MVSSEEFLQEERNFRSINVTQKAYSLDFFTKYHCCDSSLGYSFQNQLRKRVRYSWPLCGILPGHGSLHSAKGRAQYNTHQCLLEECSDSVFSWNSVGPLLSLYPKTPRCDWICSPTIPTKGPISGASISREFPVLEIWGPAMSLTMRPKPQVNFQPCMRHLGLRSNAKLLL